MWPASRGPWATSRLTVESLGGATPPTPSLADAFYVAFFPLCFVAFALLIRRGNRSSLLMTSLDGLIAGLGVAALSAAFIVAAVIRVTGGGALAAATNLVYPLGDVLLFALCIAGLLVLPKGFRPFFAVACVALAANAIGDGFNLLQPMSRFGYIANGAAWPVSLTLLAFAVWILPPNVENPGIDRIAGFTLPAFGAAISLGILVTVSFAHVGRPAIVLATVTLFVASVRLAFTVREAHSLKTARFRSLIDKTWDLITVVESDLRIAYMTPSAERVLGYAPAELEGKPFTELVHPDETRTVIEHLTGLTDETPTPPSSKSACGTPTGSGGSSTGPPPTSSTTRRSTGTSSMGATSPKHVRRRRTLWQRGTQRWSPRGRNRSSSRR